jgi:hypothetical protein
MDETGNAPQVSVKFPSAELETSLDANSTSQMDRHDIHIQLTSFPTSRVPKTVLWHDN